MKEIEFWFSIGSTYTHLSVTRLAEVTEKTGAYFSWQPFSVRKIMREMDNIPFPPSKQVKVDYMWRDIERRAQGYGFTANVPAPYPLQELDLANRVAVLARQEGWCEDYVRGTYRRWFIDGHEAGRDVNLMLPVSFKVGDISFTDKKWFWSYQDKENGLRMDTPRFAQLLPNGEIKEFSCEAISTG